MDTIRSTEPVTVEWEYQLDAPVTGLRVGMYLSTMRGEYVFTAFDTDDAQQYEQFGTRQVGRYVSRCEIPADFFNEGRYLLGVNASSFGVKRYFMDENARLPVITTLCYMVGKANCNCTGYSRHRQSYSMKFP